MMHGGAKGIQIGLPLKQVNHCLTDILNQGFLSITIIMIYQMQTVFENKLYWLMNTVLAVLRFTIIWFSSKQKLLTKPAELLLEQKDLPIEYLFIWDNNTWKRTWSNVKGAVTMASSEYEKKVDPQDSGIWPNWIMEMKRIGRFILIIFFRFLKMIDI